MEVRRAVLGDAHVDAAEARKTGFTADFQDFITRGAWGEVWTREGLSKRDRSLMTLAILTAIRSDELEIHVRGAVNNGLTDEEIAEALLHATVYAGAPAGNKAFAIAQRVLAEEGRGT